jgi:succinate dehydrogenase / fumarate reductase, cytochrome b subunit
MNIVTSIFHSSIGKKYIMALTGGLLFSFVVIHLLGNLQFFWGPDSINRYAELLKANAFILWGTRLVLLSVFLLHVTTAASITLENWAARPVPYAVRVYPYTPFAARTIVVSGVMVFAFVVYHLLHFTAGMAQPQIMHYVDAKGRHDVYRMMIEGFRNPGVSAVYLVAMGLLYFHLRHGINSLFQSLGLKDRHYGPLLEQCARWIALAIFLGFCSIPLSVLAGLVRIV